MRNRGNGPTTPIALIAAGAGLIFLSLLLDVSAPVRGPANQVDYETFMRWADEGVLEHAEAGSLRVAGRTVYGSIVYATVPEYAVPHVRLEEAGLGQTKMASDSGGARSGQQADSFMQNILILILAFVIGMVAKFTAHTMKSRRAGSRRTDRVGYQEALQDDETQDDSNRVAGQDRKAREHEDAKGARPINAKATLDSDGILTVDLEGLEGAEVSRVHVWDTDVGGDAHYIPDLEHHSTGARRDKPSGVGGGNASSHADDLPGNQTGTGTRS